MKESIRQRILHEAAYILITGCTVRQCAIAFNVSKSTVHRDCTDSLAKLDKDLYNSVREMFKYHKTAEWYSTKR